MVRTLSLLMLTLSLSPALGAEPADDPRAKLVAEGGGPVPELLRKWWKEGTAAGNAGDWYDNRDEGHSDLDTRPYPQLRRFAYTPDDLKAKRNWALATVVRPGVTFGNSSTSAPPEAGGSNVRTYYAHPRGLPFLYEQYAHNNVYIYPEHRDHDPGHNGAGDGYGDLYPANTSYLITSQGSSGSDQPFMRAIPYTLAAFRPEVKKKLVESGLLMPTLQMILRSTSRHLTDPKEYLTGKAHPAVFEGSNVDDLKMVKLAHEILPGNVPPAVRLKVVEEDTPAPGRDYFEPPGLGERLADTPGAVARVWRGKDRRRRMVLSAEDSVDLNKKPLTFTWVLLRGDPARVTIRPRDKAGASAELVVEYHERRPIAPGSPMESNRVDVGVFASNGAYHSAPAFVTFYSLDSESRTYDDKGRVLEILYGAATAVHTVPDYHALLKRLADGGAGDLLPLDVKERAAMKEVAGRLAPLEEASRHSRERRVESAKARDPANAEVVKAEAALAAAKKDAFPEAVGRAESALAAARRVKSERDEAFRTAETRSTEAEAHVRKLLDERVAGLADSPGHFLDALLTRPAADPDWWNNHLPALKAVYDAADPGRRRAADAARRRLVDLGVADKSDSLKLTFRAAREGRTLGERSLIGHFNAVALAELVLPGLVRVETRPNFVDQRLSAPKAWRDTYQYDDSGSLLGWTRHEAGKVTEFTADGLAVLKRDDTGRVVEARTVTYRQEPPAPGRGGPHAPPLTWILGDEIVRYEYADGVRKVKSREKVTPAVKPPA